MLHETGFRAVYEGALALVMQSDGVPRDLAELLGAEAAADIAYAIGRGEPLASFRYQKPTLRRLVRTARLVRVAEDALQLPGEEEFRRVKSAIHDRALTWPSAAHLYSPHGKRGYDWVALSELLRAAVAMSMDDVGWHPATLNARDFLADAEGKPLRTVYGHAIEASALVAGTDPTRVLEPLLGALRSGEEVSLTRRGSVRTTHHMGALLLHLEGAEVMLDPPRIRLAKGAIEALRTPSARRVAPPTIPTVSTSAAPFAAPRATASAAALASSPGRAWSGSIAAVTRGVIRAQAPDRLLVERGLRGHSTAEEALASALRAVGVEPLSPASNHPPFDIAWVWGGALFVAEVKSITTENEEHQLRLGLGQLLRYVHSLSSVNPERPVRGVLVPERSPSDPAWREVCRRAGVELLAACTLPGGLAALEPSHAASSFRSACAEQSRPASLVGAVTVSAGSAERRFGHSALTNAASPAVHLVEPSVSGRREVEHHGDDERAQRSADGSRARRLPAAIPEIPRGDERAAAQHRRHGEHQAVRVNAEEQEANQALSDTRSRE